MVGRNTQLRELLPQKVRNLFRRPPIRTVHEAALPPVPRIPTRCEAIWPLIQEEFLQAVLLCGLDRCLYILVGDALPILALATGYPAGLWLKR